MKGYRSMARLVLLFAAIIVLISSGMSVAQPVEEGKTAPSEEGLESPLDALTCNVNGEEITMPISEQNKERCDENATVYLRIDPARVSEVDGIPAPLPDDIDSLIDGGRD